jgi:hypothetical protein
MSARSCSADVSLFPAELRRIGAFVAGGYGRDRGQGIALAKRGQAVECSSWNELSDEELYAFAVGELQASVDLDLVG